MTRVLVIASFLWVQGVATHARADVERFAVLVGNNEGQGDEQNLRYAEDDAEKVYEVLKELGGFRPENMVLLHGEDASTARRALIALNDRIRLRTAGSEAMLFVYYSGHADARALHLGDSSLPLGELKQLVRGSPADFRLLVVDSCRSGALTRRKGGSRTAPFAIAVEEELASSGAVFLTSSAADEDAQESDRLRGSFFTHYLVSGLVGAADSNQDGRVSLDEAYRHAYENTLRASSRTLGGTQHPTFRYDLSGRGDVVLTRVRGSDRRGALVLPSGATYLVFRDDEEGPVIGEVGLHNRVRRLSVPPGTYFLRGRTRTYLLEGTVRVSARATHPVDADDLDRLEYARLVRKGASSVRLAHGPEAGYTMHTALANSTGLCHGAFVGYALHFPVLSVTPRLAYCRSRFGGQPIETTVDQLDLDLQLGHSWDASRVNIELFAAVGAGLFHQSFESTRVTPSRTSASGHVGAGVGFTVDLGRGYGLVADAAAQTYFFSLRSDDPEEGSGFEASFAAQIGLGLAKELY